MYEAYYGFKEKPFSMLPDPGFLYLSKKHQAALTLLEYGLLNQVGFCVISGEPGAGKTTILRAMLERVSDDITVGLITNTHQSFGGLLDWILSVFDLHKADLTHVEMHQVFMEYLIKEYASNRSVLLIVDEAQNMNADSLEELRMLSNVNSEKDQLLQIVLVGQPALKDLLRKPELMQFAQRIAVDYHLAPLDLEETCGYIQHRLLVAGAQRDVFTPAACERIYSYSGGSPRLINLLCETVLVFGFADQLEMIDEDLVEEMVHERMKDSVVPLVNKDVAREKNSEASKQLEENFPWIGQGQDEEEAGATIQQPPITEPMADPMSEDAADVKLEETTDAVKENSVTKEQATSANLQAEKIKQVAVEETTPVQKEKPDVLPLDDKAVSAITGEKIRPTVTPSTISEKKRATSDLLKYGVVAVVLALILIAAAVILKDGSAPTPEPVDNESQEQIKIQSQHELEDAARKKSDAEKLAREAAEQLAIDQAAAKDKLEKERAEQEKIKKDKLKKEKAALAAKERQRAETQRAEKRRAEKKLADKKRAEQIRAEQEKIAREEQVREAARLEEEKRMKEQLEAIRLENEYLKAEREAQAKKVVAPAETGAKQVQKAGNADDLAGGWIEEKVVPEEKSAGCSGPTARFKSNCR